MRAIDAALLSRFLDRALAKLTGDWVLIGGSLLPALGLAYRSTNDIDLVGTREPQVADTLKLMDIAQELDLPVETINAAGAYFLHRIPDFETMLLPLRASGTCRILRPNFRLYVQLKAERMSESDLGDCLEYLKYTRQAGEPLHRKQVVQRLQQLRRGLPPRSPRNRRHAKLMEALAGTEGGKALGRRQG